MCFCRHVICNNCFIENLLERCTMILFPEKIIDCIILGCNGFIILSGDNIAKFITDSNNEKLIKKYKLSILFYDYFLHPFFPRNYGRYLELLFDFYDLIPGLFDCCRKYETLYFILAIIGFFFGFIFIPIYIILVPISIHFTIKNLYYYKFLPELRRQYDNKFIFYSIVLGEEILSIIFIFSLIAWHYIYTILFFPILFLVVFIRNIIYKLPLCRC